MPLRALVITVAVFGLVSLYPALVNGSSADHEHAIFGLTIVAAFVVSATVFMVAINDSYVEIDGETVSIRFESFFAARFPLADIVRISAIDPRPRWRYRFGLGTNFVDRVSCSHGGALIEIELRTPQPTRYWPRHLNVTRFWLAVREYDAFVRALNAHTSSGLDADRAEAA